MPFAAKMLFNILKKERLFLLLPKGFLIVFWFFLIEANVKNNITVLQSFLLKKH